ncbi:high mobility group box domain-containing protein, partial [Trametes polyzona]
VKRPPNAFVLFRADFFKNYPLDAVTGRRVPQSIISKEAGLTWNRMPYERKEPWYSRAHLAKEEHARKYPDYRFRP